MDNKIKNIYKLFTSHKYKSLYNIIKKDPSLIKHPINDEKTILHYAVITNNIKLINKLVSINKEQLLYKSPSNAYIPQIALEAGHDNLFFELIDIFIESSNETLLFGSPNNFDQKTITNDVLLKKDFDLFMKFYGKYKKYIRLDTIYNGMSNLYVIINLFYDRLKDIITIVKDYKTDLSNAFKYPEDDNALFYLIYLYYNPNMIIDTSGKTMTKNDSKKISEDLLKDFIKLYPKQLNFTNQYYRTPIYYIAETNDVSLLKFCIDQGADVNHMSPLGYNNFCHHVMKKSNYDTVNYILNVNMNFNHVDSNNETPIFNLLRNPNFIVPEKSNDVKSNDLIVKLLEKTTNWDLQNIYGQTVVHLLTNKKDITQYFPILKTKYFDINVKNKYGTSPIQNLEQTYKNIGLKKDDITKKMSEFKELVVDNYIKTVATKIPELKSQCEKSKSDKCHQLALKYLDKPLFTDVDKLSKNYQNIYIEDHQFAYYNLYNARDVDIYYYYYMLMKKHDNLGVPVGSSLDKSKLGELVFINAKSKDDMSNVNYVQTLLNNTIKYQSLYPINIYWINSTNYIIPYNYIEAVKTSIGNGKKFIITRINIIGSVLHANMLLIDVDNKRIIRFEPQGGIDKDDINILDEKIKELFKQNDAFKTYKYFKPTDYEPINGFQSLSQETNMFNTRKGDINGFCVAWCLWFTEFYIQNVNNGLLTDDNINQIIPKVIKKLVNSGYLISEYIRNYANYMHHKFTTYLISKNFQYSNIYYDRYTDQELDNLYSHINVELEDI